MRFFCLSVSPATRRLKSPFTQPLTASLAFEKERQKKQKQRPNSSRILRSLSKDPQIGSGAVGVGKKLLPTAPSERMVTSCYQLPPSNKDANELELKAKPSPMGREQGNEQPAINTPKMTLTSVCIFLYVNTQYLLIIYKYKLLTFLTSPITRNSARHYVVNVTSAYSSQQSIYPKANPDTC